MGENTLRALASDLAYLEAWAVRDDRRSPALVGGRGGLLKFVAHHLWDPAKREAQRKHGMPQDVAGLREDGLLRSEGPHACDGQAAAVELGHPAPLAGSRGHWPPVPCARRYGRRFRRRFVPVIGRGGARLRATCRTGCSRPARRTVWPTRATSRS